MARPSSVSDEDILAAAKTAFLQHGPQVSPQVIADAVGLSQPALFKRFGTKTRLMFRALVPAGAPHFVKLLAEGQDERDISARVRPGGRAGVFGRASVRGVYRPHDQNSPQPGGGGRDDHLARLRALRRHQT